MTIFSSSAPNARTPLEGHSMFTRSHRLSTLLLSAAAFCFAVLSPSTRAQSAPVGIASTASGGGTLCAGSILTYAPTAAARKSVGDGCPATQSTMSSPVAMAIDRFDNVLVSDQTNNLLRIIYHGGTAMANALIAADIQASGLVPQKGYIYTIAGGPQSSPTTSSIYYCNQAGTGTVALTHELDGCPGAQAYLQPRGMAFDADGNIFISNVGSQYTVRVLYVGGTAAANLIKLENPNLSGDPQPGYVYLIAGNTATATLAGDGGLAYKASLNIPRGMVIDANENVILTDTQNDVIRRVDGKTGIITTIVGSTARCTGSGTAKTCPAGASAGDGAPANDASVVLNYPYGLVFDGYGNMFIADSGQGTNVGGRIRVVYAGGTLPGIANPVVGNIYTYAGGGSATGTGAQRASFQFVYGVGIDARGYLYINDQRISGTTPGSNHVWRVDPVTGDIVNIAGSGAGTALVAGAFCNGVSGPTAQNTRGDGCPGPEAYMNLPQQAPVFDSLGNFYITDRNNNVVRYFSYNNTFPATAAGASTTQTLAFTHAITTVPSSTTFTTESNTGTSEYTDAGGGTCALTPSTTPAAMVCTNNVAFTPAAAGLREGSITIGTATGPVVTEALTGVGSLPQLTIDPATITQLGAGIKPLGVSADELGNVYLSDGTGKQVLRTTIAGGATTAVITGLTKPAATATDSFGNLYVADAGSNSVIIRNTAGATSTAVAGLNAPQGLAADVLGNVYIADTGNNRLLLYSGITKQTSVVSVYPLLLSAPTALAVDSAGDLYILDSGNQRIIEYPTENSPVVITLPTGVVPSAIAVDAAGTLYVTDSTTASLLQIAPSGTSATLLTSLGSITGIATDSLGDVYLADSTLASVTALNRSVSSATLAKTNIGNTSLPATFTLSNDGNIALTFATPEFTQNGSAAAFPGSTPATCSAGLTLAPSATCTQSFVFQPTVTGPQSSTATFSTTAGGSVKANLSGTAVNLVRTTLTLTQTVPASGNANYGQTVTYTVTLTPQSINNAQPTGTITLNVDGTQVASQPVGANPYTFQLNLPVGIHTIAAAYNGDANYAGSNASASIGVDKAVTTTTASYQQISSGIIFNAVVKSATTGALPATGNIVFYVDGTALSTVPFGNGTVSSSVILQDGSHTFYAAYTGDANYAASSSAPQTFTLSRTATTTTLTIVISPAGNGLTLTAAVKPATGTGVPSGTVVFKNGANTIGTVAVSSTGTAVLTTVSTAYSSTTFSASYSGDGLFQPSVGSNGGFYGVPPLTAVGVPNGGQTVTNVSIVPVNGYTGTVTPTCSNLPANFVCRFLPTTVTLGGGVSSVLQVELFAGINPTVGTAQSYLRTSSSRVALALLLLLPAFAGRKRRRMLPVLMLAVAFVLVPLGLAGCGKQLKTPAETNNTYATPAGTYSITLTLTDASGASRNATINVTVTQ